MDRGAWWAPVHRITKRRTTEAAEHTHTVYSPILNSIIFHFVSYLFLFLFNTWRILHLCEGRTEYEGKKKISCDVVCMYIRICTCMYICICTYRYILRPYRREMNLCQV